MISIIPYAVAGINLGLPVLNSPMLVDVRPSTSLSGLIVSINFRSLRWLGIGNCRIIPSTFLSLLSLSIKIEIS